MKVQMTIRLSRRRPNVRNVGKRCRLGAMERKSVQHLIPNATNVARRDIGNRFAETKDQDRLGPGESKLKTLTRRLCLSDAYSLRRSLRMERNYRSWRIASWSPSS